MLATISDRRLQHAIDDNQNFDYYTADVITAQDYYPFGMMQPGRTYANGGAKYRYGFNGKENDNDVGKGDGNQQDYGMRIYDPRVGRFLSVDPLTKSYPWYTPYQFAGNSPIANIDLDGAEPQPVNPGTSEGQTQTTTSESVVNYKFKVRNSAQWFWHKGSDKYKTKEGWYSKYLYKQILTKFEKNVFTEKGEIIPFLTIGYVDPSARALVQEVLKEKYEEAATRFEVFPNGVPNPHPKGITPVYIEFDIALLVFAPEAQAARTAEFGEMMESKLPNQIHHFATNKSSKYTADMEAIAKQFGLKLDQAWNKQAFPHLGRHPNEYHEFVLQNMLKAADEAAGSQAKFLNLFEDYVKKPIIENPKLLRKAGWK